MESKVYRCLNFNCYCIPHIQIFDDYFEFNCENNHKYKITFEKIDGHINKLFYITKDAIDICKIHNEQYTSYCKNHEQNICNKCNEEESHKNCDLKFNFKNLESIDLNTVNQLINFVKKKNSYFSDFLQQIINVY